MSNKKTNKIYFRGIFEGVIIGLVLGLSITNLFIVCSIVLFLFILYLTEKNKEVNNGN